MYCFGDDRGTRDEVVVNGGFAVVDGGFEYFEKYGTLSKILISATWDCLKPTLVHQLRTDWVNAEGIWGAGGGKEVSTETDGEEEVILKVRKRDRAARV